MSVVAPFMCCSFADHVSLAIPVCVVPCNKITMFIHAAQFHVEKNRNTQHLDHNDVFYLKLSCDFGIS